MNKAQTGAWKGSEQSGGEHQGWDGVGEGRGCGWRRRPGGEAGLRG